MNTLKTIEVDFDLTFGELYRATLSIMLYVLRYLVLGIVALGTIYAVCSIVGSKLYSWSPDAGALADLLFPFVIGSVPTALIFIPVVAFVRAKQMLRSEGGHGRRHYVFSEEGIEVESNVASAKVKWAAYMQVRETGQYFLLYAAPGFANVVPKRHFPNPDTISAFRAIVRRQARKFRLKQ